MLKVLGTGLRIAFGRGWSCRRRGNADDVLYVAAREDLGLDDGEGLILPINIGGVGKAHVGITASPLLPMSQPTRFVGA
jgi:hypothetical protein